MRSVRESGSALGALRPKESTFLSDEPGTFHYRTLFISDVHLGKRGNSQVELFLDFLRYNDADTIYLVGDMIDGWALKGGWFWPQSHNDVVQKLLRKVRKGSKVFFLPGNHDEFARSYLGMNFGGIDVVDTAMHEMADGRRFWILHGDQFDIVVRNAKWLALLGDWTYEVALYSNYWFNKARRAMGFQYWSFSAWAKLKVKEAVSFIGAFETTLASEARKQGADGVVCGHIHHAAIRDIDGITYVNIGDFVESCTAVGEHADGRLEIIQWQTAYEERAPADRKQGAFPAEAEAAA